ncbi:restriction endonuclease subunit S [Pelomicrobium sp. G1]|uniref:restriction endonuclease subunit S n=1 Tax=unclassified Pelomicrobium TaxID=2815318 RepID=UPI003F768EEC
MSEAVRMLRAEPLRRFKPYPAYKDSGVEWLGEIPAHWEVKRLKRLVEFRGGGTPTKDSIEYWRGDIPWVSPKDMKVWIVDDTEDKITLQAVRESATKLVPKGAVLIVVRSGILAHSIPVAIAGRELTLNQDLKALIPREILLSDYLAQFISGMQRELLVAWKKEGATVESLELDLVTQTPTLVPPPSEQRAIAAFLDRETARIDALVAKKERLIELLQEKRTALITRAVTKGLDPTVPMKDSGVEWLGEIPVHWTATALKRIGELQAGAGFPDDEQGVLDEEVPFFKVGDMGMPGNEREMLVHQHSVSRATARRLGAFVFPPRTIVFAKVGAALLLNRRRLLVRPSCIDNNMMGFIPYECDPTWALYWLSGLDMGELANPGAVPSVNEGQMRDTPAAVPPEPEQRAIAAFLDRETARIDALIAKIRDAIDRLKELRTALISAAVTGKIDVREEVA